MTDNPKIPARKFSYPHRLVMVLVIAFVIGAKLYFNSGTGDNFLLMTALLAVVLPTALYL